MAIFIQVFSKLLLLETLNTWVSVSGRLVIAGIVILTIIGTVIDVIFVRKCHPITVNNNEKATQAAKEQDFSLKIYSKGVNCRRTTNGDSAGVDEDGKAREKVKYEQYVHIIDACEGENDNELWVNDVHDLN